MEFVVAVVADVAFGLDDESPDDEGTKMTTFGFSGDSMKSGPFCMRTRTCCRAARLFKWG